VVIIGMPGWRYRGGHVAYVCPGRHSHSSCMWCDGGLFYCQHCHSFEGATTTHCSGELMTADQADAVYAGRLDYQDGRWITGQASLIPPAGHDRRERIRAGLEPIPDGY
jgi:hypothetical protein